MGVMKPEEIVELLTNETVQQFSPDYIKDVLNCSEALRLTGCDSLLYQDGEVIAALVDWHRGEGQWAKK